MNIGTNWAQGDCHVHKKVHQVHNLNSNYLALPKSSLLKDPNTSRHHPHCSESPQLDWKNILMDGGRISGGCNSGIVGGCMRMMSFLSLRAKPMKWEICDNIRSGYRCIRGNKFAQYHSFKILYWFVGWTGWTGHMGISNIETSSAGPPAPMWKSTNL